MAIYDWKHFATDEYVRAYRIAQYIDRPVNDLYKMGFFDDIPFKVDASNTRTYKYVNCLRKARVYGLNPPTKEHPYAKWRPYEIVNDLGISPYTYNNYVKAGMIVEQQPDEHGRYVFYRDYDHFLKNYVPTKMFAYLVNTMNIKDSAAFIGIRYGQLRGKIRTNKAQVVAKIDPKSGVRRYKWMTRDQIIQYINSTIENAKKKTCALIRNIPLPDTLSTNMACMYMKVTRRTLTNYVFYGWLHPTQVKKGARKWNFYDKKELDELYDRLERKIYYGEGKEYYSRFAIRNKFGKSDYWIDNLVVGKCRVVVPTEVSKTRKPKGYQICTVEEYAKLNAEAKDIGRPGYPLWGWVQEDVDAIVKSGVNVDPKMELSEFRKKCLARLDKTNHRKVNAQKKKAKKAEVKTKRLKRNEVIVDYPEMDSMEVAIKAALYENELRAEDKKHELHVKKAKINHERNILRRALGLTERPEVKLSNDDVLKHSEVPSVVTFLYRRRSGKAPVLYKKTSNSRDELVYVTSDQPVTMKRKNNPQQSIFLNISRLAEKINRLHPKAMPSWIILAHTSSIVYDMAFIRKLENVPPEYGAVAPFGYEYILPDGTWTRCPNTYGMYSEFSINDELMTTRVAGTVTAVGNHEVAVLDGPFVAVRGGYLPYLRRFAMLYQFGDGRGCVPYVISMMMHRLGVKMQQIEVDSSWCVDVNMPFTPIEWNQIEPKLVELGKSLVPNYHLNPKTL